jgi:predicted nuclease of predicted toxin-antitoxin system
VRFLADMGISPRSVAFLRDRGVEAVHLNELRLDRLSDAEVVKKAQREGYVVLTHDLDFAELVALSGAELPSVVIFRLRNMRPDNVNRYLEVLVTEHQTALDQGAIFSISEGRIRVRTLPVEG